MSHYRSSGGPEDTLLLNGPDFSLFRAASADAIPAAISSRQRWVMPLEGTATSGGHEVARGECMVVAAGEPLALSPSALVLVGVAGPL
jgi:hypothetical protein